ncbi:MAG: dihydroneopterin aldolase [Chitinophagales bacterium]|nr:dihydroneopterin aldolase [Chitinophagales bacterium]
MLIALEGLQLYAHHGYYDEEQIQGGNYEIDVYIDMPQVAACLSDQLTDTINYETIAEVCRAEMQQPARLIEHVAYRIIERIAQTLSQTQIPIAQIKIRLSKYDVPIGITLRRAFVEIEKSC